MILKIDPRRIKRILIFFLKSDGVGKKEFVKNVSFDDSEELHSVRNGLSVNRFSG